MTHRTELAQRKYYGRQISTMSIENSLLDYDTSLKQKTYLMQFIYKFLESRTLK